MCNISASKLYNTNHKLIPPVKWGKKKPQKPHQTETVTQQNRQTKQPPRKNKTNTKPLTNLGKYKNQVKEAEIQEQQMGRGSIERTDNKQGQVISGYGNKVARRSEILFSPSENNLI